jgi:hypothetical protein
VFGKDCCGAVAHIIRGKRRRSNGRCGRRRGNFVGKKPSRGNGGYLRNRYHLIGGLLQFLLELLGLETDLICIGTGIVKYYMIMITIMLIVIVIVYY